MVYILSKVNIFSKNPWIVMLNFISKLFFRFKSRFNFFFYESLFEKKQFHYPQPREIPRHRRLGRAKMPLHRRHFMETKFLLRKDRSAHSISIISMVKTVSWLKMSLVDGYSIGIWDQLSWKWRQNTPCFRRHFFAWQIIWSTSSSNII